MRSILIALVFLLVGNVVIGQTGQTEEKKKKDWTKVDLGKRAADHLMIQIGMYNWASKPDSIKTKGVGRTANLYIMFDFPFKTNPRISVALGPGIGTDNIYFDNTTINIKNRLQATFIQDSVTRYKKYKMNVGYLELPVELRFSSSPQNMNKGFKFALGAKLGTLMDAKTKAKVDQDANGYGGYIEKIKDKKFFNGTRLSATARIGYGHFTVFGTYTTTQFFKEFQGPIVKPWSLGLTISGL
jgi:hypothetical protein